MTSQPLLRTEPHSSEAEATVIGALLLDDEAIFKVIASLQAADFYDPVYRDVYAAIKQLAEEGSGIDFVTVTHKLESHELLSQLGGSAFLAELATKVPTASHIEKYAGIVIDKSRRRGLARVGNKITGLATDTERTAAQLTEIAEQHVLQLARHGSSNDPVSIGSLRGQRYDHYVHVFEAEDPTTFCGIPTGFSEIDHKLTGLASGQLTIVAGRPGMGKTALALDIASNVACEQGKSVLICSLEMTKEELFGRLLSKRLAVESWKLERGAVSEDEFGKMGPVLDAFADYPLFIDDDADSSLSNIGSKARCQQMRHGLDLLIVDYLQLIEVTELRGSDNRTQVITTISRGLKKLARELRCPVIALSQLSRACEQRADKRPVLSDLRDSGSIEQDADRILMLYRESEYNELCDDPDLTSVYIRKNRQGPKGEVVLNFNRQRMSFEELDASGKTG